MVQPHMTVVAEPLRGSAVSLWDQPICTDFGLAYILELDNVKGTDEFAAIFSSHRKDHRCLQVIEETIRNGFQYRYLLLEDQRGRMHAIQPFFVLNQDLMAGTGLAVQKVMRLVRKVAPRMLTMRTLMVGLTTSEGRMGAGAEDVEWCAGALHAALGPCARRLGASMVVLKEFPSELRRDLACFSNGGYARIPSMPYTALELNFRDFDEYMQTVLSKSFRKNLRRKFRDAARLLPLSMEVVSDITPHIHVLYPLYLQVYQRSKLKFEKLTKEYLCRMGAEVPDKARFFIWRQEDRAVAFSVCTLHDDALWDEYLGMDYGVALDLHLYFLTLRDVINWCCQQGLKRYYSTALAYGPKLHLRFSLVPMDLYVRHTNRWINVIMRRALRFLEPTRSDPSLKKFVNADQL